MLKLNLSKFNQSGPVGILLKDVIEQNGMKAAKVLVIRPGMSQQLEHIELLQKEEPEGGIEYLVTKDGAIDWNDVTTEESIAYTMNTVREYKPDLIIAGSRGADLVLEIIKEYKCRFLLFGPVHLDDVFTENTNVTSSQKNVIVVVHGQDDNNMRINRVRYLVNENNQHLVEIENMGHTLRFNESSNIRLLVDYALEVKIGELKSGGSKRKKTKKTKTKKTKRTKSRKTKRKKSKSKREKSKNKKSAQHF
tara:strand:- start:5231 stop:5980 length:750 start_codon:yes stop_codon:yes gene_type:complete